MTDFKATPDQWDRIRRWGLEMGSCRDACIVELLSRIEALEQAASEQIRTALEEWDK
jgi:hypothetical protein